ncbi:hypothetical protein [Halomicrobium sp. LC1Hm]|uniref:hypothetical protein n=1 Tax=Halomicrobium sp. LC1Hm TaxID=2610902 RepID=UPI0012984696|nr:hypothetical protein [Halomicrobium sp. LC1Hm]
MQRRRFLQSGSVAVVAGLAGCSSLLGTEDAENAARAYRDAYFAYEKGQDHAIQGRLAASEGSQQARNEQLQLAVDDFQTAKSRFDRATENMTGKPEQDATRAREKSDLLQRAAQARLDGNISQAIELENQARGMEVENPRIWRASTSL